MPDNIDLLDAVRDTILLVDRNGIIVDYYAHPETILLKGRTDIKGTSVTKVKTIKTPIKLIRACIKTQNRQNIDFKLIIEGKERDFHVRLEPASEECIYAVIKEVTEKIAAEVTLKESEKKFRDIFSSITDIYYQTDRDRNFTVISPSVEKISGFTPDRFIGKKTIDFISRKDSLYIYNQLKRYKKITNYHIAFDLNDGDRRMFSVNAEANFNKKGEFMGTSGLLRDITERKIVEEKIAEVAKRYHDLFEYGNDAIFIADSKIQNILDVNKKTEELLGYTREELLQKKLLDIRPKADQNNFKKRLRKLKKEGHLISEAVLQRKDGSIVQVEYSARIIDVNGHELYQSLTRDITKRKQEETIAMLNKEVLELVTKEGELQQILARTCHGIQEIFGDMICSILLFDEKTNTLVHGASPSLPKFLVKAQNGFPVGPQNGSCGTAVHFKREVVVTDLYTDPLWASWRSIMKRTKIQACTSVPIMSSDKKVLGTFAVYYKTQKTPADHEMETIRNFGNLLSVAIENAQSKYALVASERRYRTLVDNAPVAIIIHTDGIIKFANKEAMRIGRAKKDSDLIGKNALDFVKDNYKKDAAQRMGAVQQGQRAPRTEQRFVRVDGTILDVEIMGSPIAFHGQPSVQLVFYDITERKDADRKLVESENRYRQFVDHAPIGIIIHDVDKIRYVNIEMMKIAKAAKREDLEGKSILDFVSDEYKKFVQRRISVKSEESRLIPRQEEQFVCLDGSVIDIDVVGMPITLQGETLVQSAFYDITEKKNAESKLIESEERYRSLNDSVSDAIIISNKDGKIVSWNHGAEKIFGYTELDVLKKDVTLIIPQGEEDVAPLDEFTNFLRSKKKKGSQEVHEFEVIGKSGRVFPVEVSRGHWKAGKESYFSALIRDISERKTAEERQKKLNEFLIKQNKQLEEFAHIASHNLRAPIANIEALIKLYELDPTKENSEFIFDQLGIVSHNLNDTINDLTDVIKTTWELNKQKQKLKFTEICQKVLQSVSRTIINTDADISTDFGDAPEIVYPKVYLESIMQNLISNALKYRHPDRKPNIEIKTSSQGRKVTLQVKDNGLGIDMAKHGQKLFGLRKTFHKNEDARGVGLFITKAQVESMGGIIEVTSKVGIGSLFVINFGEM